MHNKLLVKEEYRHPIEVTYLYGSVDELSMDDLWRYNYTDASHPIEITNQCYIIKTGNYIAKINCPLDNYFTLHLAQEGSSGIYVNALDFSVIEFALVCNPKFATLKAAVQQFGWDFTGTKDFDYGLHNMAITLWRTLGTSTDKLMYNESCYFESEDDIYKSMAPLIYDNLHMHVDNSTYHALMEFKIN